MHTCIHTYIHTYIHFSDPGIPYSELPYFMSLGSSDEEQNAKRGEVKQLVIRTLLAELLHISRPLVHSEFVICKSISYEMYL